MRANLPGLVMIAAVLAGCGGGGSESPAPSPAATTPTPAPSPVSNPPAASPAPVATPVASTPVAADPVPAPPAATPPPVGTPSPPPVATPNPNPTPATPAAVVRTRLLDLLRNSWAWTIQAEDGQCATVRITSINGPVAGQTTVQGFQHDCTASPDYSLTTAGMMWSMNWNTGTSVVPQGFVAMQGASAPMPAADANSFLLDNAQSGVPSRSVFSIAVDGAAKWQATSPHYSYAVELTTTTVSFSTAQRTFSRSLSAYGYRLDLAHLLAQNLQTTPTATIAAAGYHYNYFSQSVTQNVGGEPERHTTTYSWIGATSAVSSRFVLNWASSAVRPFVALAQTAFFSGYWQVFDWGPSATLPDTAVIGQSGTIATGFRSFGGQPGNVPSINPMGVDAVQARWSVEAVAGRPDSASICMDVVKSSDASVLHKSCKRVNQAPVSSRDTPYEYYDSLSADGRVISAP